jgi:hypothetical protein
VWSLGSLSFRRYLHRKQHEPVHRKQRTLGRWHADPRAKFERMLDSSSSPLPHPKKAASASANTTGARAPYFLLYEATFHPNVSPCPFVVADHSTKVEHTVGGTRPPTELASFTSIANYSRVGTHTTVIMAAGACGGSPAPFTTTF